MSEAQASTVEADIDAIIAMATDTGSTNQPVEESTDQPIDRVAADVDAILAEINGTAPAPAQEEPKTTRKRGKKSTDTTAAATPPAPVVAAGANAAPTPAPAATNTGAFRALLAPNVAKEYQGRFDALAVKVKDKATNAENAIDTGKKLSRFTSLAVKTLVDKGAVTSGDLVEVYKGENLAEGTARAQAQQMTSLFRAFGLVTQDGKTFKLANEQLGKQLAAAA